MDIYNQSIITISSLKDLLHLGVVYLNLILQLLRTNEQFKNVLHETIVIEPCDLQNIVYNSFSCYLNSKQLSGGSGFNVRLIDVIEEWLCTNGYSENETNKCCVIDTNDCDSRFLTDDQHKGIFDVQYDIEYTNIINGFYTSGTTFNYRSHTDFKNKNSFIDNVILNKCDSVVKDFNKETVQSEYSENGVIVNGVKKIRNFLTNNVFDHFFVNSNSKYLDEETRSEAKKRITKSETDCSIYIKDYDTAECNSLFLQLFEIAAGVMILANWDQSSSGEYNGKLLFFFCFVFVHTFE